MYIIYLTVIQKKTSYKTVEREEQDACDLGEPSVRWGCVHDGWSSPASIGLWGGFQSPTGE